MVSKIRENLQQVRTAITRAALRAGRDPTGVRLVAVTKGVPVEVIEQVLAEGVVDLGENRVQELVAKYKLLGDKARWHFIGYLQRNKVKYLVKRIALLHSLDRWSLAQELDRWGQREGFVFPALVQVNVAREPQKHGLLEEEVEDFLLAVRSLKGVKVLGFMTVAPRVAEAEEVRPVFRRLAEIAQKYTCLPGVEIRYLSMGMTQDFEVAVEEGANIVRVGRAIFQGLGEGEGDEQASGGQGAGLHRF